MADAPGENAEAHHHGLKDKIAHPFPHLREKLHHHDRTEPEDQHHPHPENGHPIAAKVVHTKQKIGKLANLFNKHHRHDEAHEKAVDEQRKKIAEGHRFGSFAPEREGNLIKWYVDGRDYFWAVSVALERAKETIYIEDWWLSPELYLRRPPFYNQEWRLDTIIKRKAEQGVKIYIIVYKEVKAALTCNSEHTKRVMMHDLIPEGQKGHGNIRLMRHPDHDVFENFADMTFYWAHHEKFIVIDYEVAFIGGLDLCYGRWDLKQHPCADVHPLGVQYEIFPGQDYNNNRILDFQNVQDWKQNQLSKVEYGRMPWHDVAMGVIGPCVYDIAEHFVLRWNFCKRDKYKRDPRYTWLTLEGREGDDEGLVGVQRPKFPVGGYEHHPLSKLSTKNLDNRGTVHAQILRSSADWSSGIDPEETSIQTAYCELIRKAQHFVYIENQFFISATGEHQDPIHNRIAEAIVDAIVRAAKEQRKFRVIVLIPAIPGFAGDLRENAALGTRAIMDYQYKTICRGPHSIFGKLDAEGIDPHKYIFFFNLRSYDRINANRQLRENEKRSGMKYEQLQSAEEDELSAPTEKNEKERATAAKMREQFFPDNKESVGKGDQGGIIDPDSIADDAMLTDKKPSTEEWDGDPQDEKDHFFQEELYIHAKVCIIDDKYVICGSANINDRSQIGYHDSELAIVMEDTDKVETLMDGKPYQAGRHAYTLRSMLWREHLGLLPPQALDASDDPNAQPPGDSTNDAMEGPEMEFVKDPLSDDLWADWTSKASTNTSVYRELFHVDPDDDILTFEDYDSFTPNAKTDKEHKQGHLYVKDMSAEEMRKQLDRIRGHLVWMPLRFLEREEMAEKGLNLQFNAWTESIYT
ncbi:phospholipase-like protein PldA [Westerdykella ornata]|uniref:Phospholipase n=1 Tax=Westerdykella ornata TaxID=318751 RepID=A0A6A6JU89_WESOR|nr:phospholipase-like protein PldA [Westerdykella ornata]KAF2279398.1 phospholipase-like protein PldA [Westerdykella ornata]